MAIIMLSPPVRAGTIKTSLARKMQNSIGLKRAKQANLARTAAQKSHRATEGSSSAQLIQQMKKAHGPQQG